MNAQNSTKSMLRRIGIFGLTMAISAAGAMAQLAGKGGLTGHVVDSTGAAVPGAKVVVRSDSQGTTREMPATSAGDYTFSLDPGTYTLTVTFPGFKTYVQKNIKMDAMQTFSVDAKLETGDVTESVTVTDAPPVLESSNATLGTTIEQEQYSSLPLIQDGTGQRRATDFAALLPGVNGQVTNGNSTTNAGSVNGSGSRGAVSAIYIDGVPITSVAGEGDPRFVWSAFAVDSIDQFQVQTSGYSAIYEGQGVQNYNVKSGTNKIHGSVYDYYRDTGLDTWGFQKVNSPITGLPQKPSEHQHEYGLFLGFPVIKDKLFVFGGYEGYRFRRQVPYSSETIPVEAWRQGNFASMATNPALCNGSTTAVAGCLYDPTTTVYHPAVGNTAAYLSRSGFVNNVVPLRSAVAQKMQSFLPASNGLVDNNYVVNYKTGLNNWSASGRIDYDISTKQRLSVVLAWGRQATTAPAAVSTSAGQSSNGLPAPYISSQQFSPKTKVFLAEDTYTINSHLVNQFKFGFGRYDGPGYNQNTGGSYGASALGIQGLPSGQIADSFPTTTFTGNNTINRWAGYSSNRPVANGFVLVDNLQWTIGRHNFTFGGEDAWLQYNYLNNTTGSAPLALTFNSTATQGFTTTTTGLSTTGNAYASFLLGAVTTGTGTVSAVPETGGRYNPISGYVQDNWKVTDRLTLDLGVRYDYYPTYREVQDRFSFWTPTVTNSITGTPGAYVLGGFGNGRCNCHSPTQDFFKGFSPRLGFAYQATPTTLIRGSYGVMYTHGNANGGSAVSRQGTGTTGFSTTASTTFSNPNAAGVTGSTFWNLDQSFATASNYVAPSTNPNAASFANTYTYYSTGAAGISSGSPTYADPYYGSRAPQFINYSFGIQQQLGTSTALTITYVGSQGHFLTPDTLNGRGQFINQLDPKYLGLGSQLSNPATTASLAAAGVNTPYASFLGSQGSPTIGQALKPYAQYTGMSDAYGFVGNTSYNSLQVYATRRFVKGFTFMANYNWSKSIDNNGTFRSGYDIPAAYAEDGKFHAARSLDRSLSLADQRHKVVMTGSWDLPFGKGSLGGQNLVTRNILGGFKLSSIFSAYSGAPMSFTLNSANTNPSQAVAYSYRNPNYSGNGKLANRPALTSATLGKTQYLDPNAWTTTPNYRFAVSARTAPYSGLFQPGNYRWDLSLRREIKIPNRFASNARLTLEADYFNVTNHTHFVYSASNAVQATIGSSTYGTLQVDTNSAYNRAAQLAARFDF
ncbi:MAG: TonB-dependent receptor [Acidobacteriaceae bacterium]|nr:TonB-dependent receptor [Acidobacteriaceae bacterium]